MARRKKGGYLTYPITPWWRQALQAWIDVGPLSERGQSALARKVSRYVKCSPSSISRILSGEYEESAVVEPICIVTGLQLPTIPATPGVREWAEAALALEARDPALLKDVGAYMARLAETLGKKL